jgi:putative spermidine/putrescine transport system ATP-binding protein
MSRSVRRPKEPARPADVRLIGATKRFGSVVAVDDVDLTINPGEFVALLGPSGSGKTTTLRMIAGFVQPDTGEIRIGGSRYNNVPPHKRNLGMVFQRYELFPHMTVADNVAYGLKMRKQPRAERDRRSAEALDLVRLPGYGSRYPKQLSGGQQQRVALARAIVIDPLVLLLDEPLGALDKKLREEMQIELKALQRRLGVTTIFVTHDQEEALTMADRIAVMNHGRIEQVGTPAEIYETPRTRFVADFIGLSNFLTATVRSISPDAIHADLEGGPAIVLSPWNGAAVDQRVEVALRPEKIRILPADGNLDGANCFPARIEQVVYQGEGSYIFARLTPATMLQVYAPNDGDMDRPRLGDQGVTIAWYPSNARVLEPAP